MEEVMLRAAKLTDVDSIYNMICKLEEKVLDKNAFKEIFKENLSKNDIDYIVAEYQDKVVGFISLYIHKLLHHAGNAAEIQEFYVDPTLRGKGIGTKLIAYAKRVSENNDCKIFEVSCNLKRKETHKFYKKKGFLKTHFKFTSKLADL